jgi:predicted cupin superfamily sugar epimerase
MTLSPRAAALIANLDLQPHPEGGYYRQVYESASHVQPGDARPSRRSLTTIYFLLPAGDISRWHRVTSDEVWHHYEGAPLELLVADPAFAAVASHRLGPCAPDARPVHVVAAHDWQAARSTGEFTLVGCTVAPGFVFDDFTMLSDMPALADTARRQQPQFAAFV